MKNKIIVAIFFGLFFLSLYYRITYRPHEERIQLQRVSFAMLPGWHQGDFAKSLAAFKQSCRAFLKQRPDKDVGSDFIPLQAKDWQPACQAAQSVKPNSAAAKSFFESWFLPMAIQTSGPVEGLFTGYYSPLLHGSLEPSKVYNVPLYNTPSDLITVNLARFHQATQLKRLVGRVKGRQLIPYYTRAQINRGALKKVAQPLLWIDDLVDRQFLEIQGSGIVELPDGKRLLVGYDNQNGAPYTSLAKILIDKGVMTRDNASMQGIKKYLQAHPEEKKAILNQNQSFVFFKVLNSEEALGSQGVELTPGRSLAVDRQWIPLGAPIWLQTTHPGEHTDNEHPLEQLMVAQDTGGAIKGVVRGDVYWGAGEKATHIAGHMKNRGYYWLLLPRQVVESRLN